MRRITKKYFMETQQSAAARFLNPDAIIAQLEVAKNSKVADFGCGPGFFSLPFSKIVGDDGVVYALDILPQALETVNGKTKNSGINNVVTKRVNFEKENGSKLEKEAIDWVVLKDVLFQNQKKEVIIAEARRILKPGGKILLVEWNEKDAGIGPEMNIRLAKHDLEAIFAAQNFAVEKEINAGDFHYAFVAVKK
jgi:ubiquinone/menaquinone biosynthesis C-methylase UbiE